MNTLNCFRNSIEQVPIPRWPVIPCGVISGATSMLVKYFTLCGCHRPWKGYLSQKETERGNIQVVFSVSFLSLLPALSIELIQGVS